MDHQLQLEFVEGKNEKFYFQLKDEEGELVCKSNDFDSLHDCHEAIVMLKYAIANTQLSTTNVKHQL